jgi:hypothetical protein
MSATKDDTDSGDPTPVNEVVSTGAAADSAGDERFKGLPRLLRYAVMSLVLADHVEKRLIAEIGELCPQLPQGTAWLIAPNLDSALALAAELDHRAVTQDEPSLRSLADSVRLVSLPTPRDGLLFEEHRRVGKALVQAFEGCTSYLDRGLCCQLELLVYGWAALPVCTDLVRSSVSALTNAVWLGSRMVKQRIQFAEVEARREANKERDKEQQRRNEAGSKAALQWRPETTETAVSDSHLIVAHLSAAELKNVTIKDILRPLESVINTPLPLIKAPPLHEARKLLAYEFPYAIDVIDFALTDLVGRTSVHLRPLLLVGHAGSGKSRFARRLGDVLGVTVWRTDGAHPDGSTFGGTGRRWHSAEPCHPLLAIARGRIANPLILIDEIEKAATRSDYGRLWDSLLGFLEPETNCRYPDPALQTNLDLSEVSYIATANTLDALPSPIRDRFRIVRFPMPTAGDLDALLPAVLADLAKERGLDRNWVPPLDGIERDSVARSWSEGSVRRLRRVVEAILRHREVNAVRH